MPLIVQLHPKTADTSRYFAKVLSDQPKVQAQLEQANDKALLVEAIFNGQPVALMLGTKQNQGCHISALVVHPATRGRHVGTELLNKGFALLPKPVDWHADMHEMAKKLATNE